MKIGIQTTNRRKTSPAWYYSGACCFCCPRNTKYRWLSNEANHSGRKLRNKRRLKSSYATA